MDIIICDDEQFYIDQLRNILLDLFSAKKIPLNIIIFNSGKECVQYLLSHDVDLVFLDIFLGDSIGTDMAMELRLAGKNFKLIFLSTSNEFAADSFRVRASYYLLKPPTQESVLQALNVARVFAQMEIINVDTGIDIFQLNTDELIAIEVYDKYCHIHTVNGSMSKYCALKKIYAQLTQPCFVQVNRSFVINFNYVEKLDKTCFVMKNGMSIQLKSRGARLMREQYIKWLFGTL